MTTRIGFLGGAFNPPHHGHLRAALEAMETLALERLILIPSGQHPFKGGEVLAPARHRLEMTRLACAGEPRFEVCETEINRPEVSFTIDTLRVMNQRHPDAEAVLLLGTDLFGELHLWKHWQELLRCAHVGVLSRAGFSERWQTTPAGQEFSPHQVWEPAELKRRGESHAVITLPVTSLEISSSDLRQRLWAGRSIRFLTPDAVVDHIHAHRLYSAPER